MKSSKSVTNPSSKSKDCEHSRGGRRSSAAGQKRRAATLALAHSPRKHQRTKRGKNGSGNNGSGKDVNRKWDVKEEMLLRKAIKKHGERWTMIKNDKEFKGIHSRTFNGLKKKWRSMKKKDTIPKILKRTQAIPVEVELPEKNRAVKLSVPIPCEGLPSLPQSSSNPPPSALRSALYFLYHVPTLREFVLNHAESESESSSPTCLPLVKRWFDNMIRSNGKADDAMTRLLRALADRTSSSAPENVGGAGPTSSRHREAEMLLIRLTKDALILGKNEKVASLLQGEFSSGVGGRVFSMLHFDSRGCDSLEKGLKRFLEPKATATRFKSLPSILFISLDSSNPDTSRRKHRTSKKESTVRFSFPGSVDMSKYLEGTAVPCFEEEVADGIHKMGESVRTGRKRVYKPAEGELGGMEYDEGVDAVLESNVMWVQVKPCGEDRDNGVYPSYCQPPAFDYDEDAARSYKCESSGTDPATVRIECPKSRPVRKLDTFFGLYPSEKTGNRKPQLDDEKKKGRNGGEARNHKSRKDVSKVPKVRNITPDPYVLQGFLVNYKRDKSSRDYLYIRMKPFEKSKRSNKARINAEAAWFCAREDGVWKVDGREINSLLEGKVKDGSVRMLIYLRDAEANQMIQMPRQHRDTCEARPKVEKRSKHTGGYWRIGNDGRRRWVTAKEAREETSRTVSHKPSSKNSPKFSPKSSPKFKKARQSRAKGDKEAAWWKKHQEVFKARQEMQLKFAAAQREKLTKDPHNK
mmetsp:Transcript_31343/g.76461  ORF Transcript_31343/g.76461 Transcript_31343/m.76461 type:complete len:749 (-) Transcript_31343:325-2571(-)